MTGGMTPDGGHAPGPPGSALGAEKTGGLDGVHREV